MQRPGPLVIGHRGAPGYLPEHTLESYQLAIALGADSVEPDLVMTRDGVLVIRHESGLRRTTDVAARPGLAALRSTRTAAGRRITDWFVEDLTLAQLSSLRATERFTAERPRSAVNDGRYRLATFDELLLLVAEQARATGRTIGVHAELKHPARSAGLGLPLEVAVLDALGDHGLDHRRSQVHLQSFEVTCLRRLRERTDVRLVQLIGDVGAPEDLAAAADPTTYDDLVTPGGLRMIAQYADAVGLPKCRLLDPRPWDPEPSALIEAAKLAGLDVLVYTVRNENHFLAERFRVGPEPGAVGDVVGETEELLDLGVDGVFTDQPDTTALVRSGWSAAALPRTPA